MRRRRSNPRGRPWPKVGAARTSRSRRETSLPTVDDRTDRTPSMVWSCGAAPPANGLGVPVALRRGRHSAFTRLVKTSIIVSASAASAVPAAMQRYPPVRSLARVSRRRSREACMPAFSLPASSARKFPARRALLALASAATVVAGSLVASPAAAAAVTVLWVSPSGSSRCGRRNTPATGPLTEPGHDWGHRGAAAPGHVPAGAATDASMAGTRESRHPVVWTAAPGAPAGVLRRCADQRLAAHQPRQCRVVGAGARRPGHPPALRRRRTGAARQRPGPGDADLDEHRVHRVGADHGELAQPQPDRARLHRWRRVLGPAHRRAGRLDRAAVPGGVDLRYYDHDGAAVLGQ